MSNNHAPRQRMGGPMGGGRGHVPMSFEKAKDFKGTAKKLMKYMRKDLVVMIIAFILAIGGVIATITLPDILGNATDTLVVGVMQKSVYKNVVPSLKFDDEMAEAFENAGNTSIGDIKNLLNMDEILDPNWKEIVESMSEDTKKMILSLPEGFDTVRLVKLAEASKNAATLGEYMDIINNTALLDNIPDSYVQDVRAISMTSAPEIDTDKIANIMIKLMILILASGIMSYAQGFLLSGVSQKISYRFRKDLNEKIDTLPLKYYDKTTNGESAYRYF